MTKHSETTEQLRRKSDSLSKTAFVVQIAKPDDEQIKPD
jgi:hypothetical protein